MLQTVLAAFGLTTCILLAVHMALPRRLRARVDAAMARLTDGIRQQLDRAAGWRRHRRQSRAAAMEADRAIRRARESSQTGDRRLDGDWDGNVYRPKSFEKPKKPH